MRTAMIEVTMKMPLYIDKPDLNGAIYTKEALENAVSGENKFYPPITFLKGEVEIPLGIVNDIKFIKEDNKYYYLVTGFFWKGGTCENVKFDTSKDMITSMDISSIGFSL